MVWWCPGSIEFQDIPFFHNKPILPLHTLRSLRKFKPVGTYEFMCVERIFGNILAYRRRPQTCASLNLRKKIITSVEAIMNLS